MRSGERLKSASRIGYELQSNSSSTRPWSLRIKPVCASTELDLSRWLEEKPFKNIVPRAVFAGRQQFGRGQNRRIWESRSGGVWMSAALPLLNLEKLYSAGLFGLAVALALAERLEKKGVQVQIKWPNDLVVSEKKLAGLLPRLIHRGGELRLARVGIGLNVCNKVPVEGISLSKILPPFNCYPAYWSAEVLIALDRAMDLFENSQLICSEVFNRLWSKEFLEPTTGESWSITGLGINGELKIRKGFRNQSLVRFGDGYFFL